MGVSNIKLKGNISDKRIDKIFILLVALLPLFFGSMYTLTTAAASENTTKVEITSPPDAAVLEMTVDAQGIAENVSKGQKLWIVVSDGHAHYFPQTLVEFENNTSEWHADVVLGGQDDGSMYYRINAVLADEEANSTLTNDSQNKTLKAEGIPFLPEGAERVDYVAVVRIKYPTFWEKNKEVISAIIGSAIAGLFGVSCLFIGIEYEKRKKFPP